MKYNDVVYTNGEYITAMISEQKQDYKYNVAFLGGMLPEKGSKKACEMIQTGTKDICWHVFGSVGDVDLINLQQPNLVKHGTYKQQDVPQLLSENKIDIVCILSVLPETFCYTLSEAVYSNVPVFVTDIGASGDRVKRHQYGWTVPVDYTGEQMSAYLLQILENRSEYALKKKIVTEFQEITFSEMAETYKNIYQVFQCENPKEADFDRVLIFKGLGMENGAKNTPYMLRNLSNSNDEFYQEMEKIWDEYQYLKIMKQSKGYRLIEKLRENALVRAIYKLVK
jgi:glycosyltransferase involved in cell wall biosynthesis